MRRRLSLVAAFALLVLLGCGQPAPPETPSNPITPATHTRFPITSGVHAVGCNTCHGPVDQMPLTWKENTLYMRWCFDCHKHPETNIRPREQVFNMRWSAPRDQSQAGPRLVATSRGPWTYRSANLARSSVCTR